MIILKNNKRRVVCDREIGSVKKGWGLCLKPATREVKTRFSNLDYCEACYNRVKQGK